MRKINKAEFEKLLASQNTPADRFKRTLTTLQLNQAVVIGKKEWPYKTSPASLTGQVKGRKFITRSLKKSYAVLRIK